MSSTDPIVKYQRNGEFINELTTTPTGLNDPSVVHEWRAYRWLHISLADSEVENDGADTEAVTVKVVSGLDVARGDSPTVLDYDGDVTLSVDGQQTTKTLTNGSLSFDLTTDKPAGTEIEVVAESLADHPAESDSATIEVVS